LPLLEIEEQRALQQAESDKSISTDASLEEIAFDFPFQQPTSITDPDHFQPNQSKIKGGIFNQETSYFCKKVEQSLMMLKRKLMSNSQKIHLEFFMFLYDFLVVNHIDLKEIDIFFSFMSSLTDARLKRIYLTEASFSRLLYEILLRLEWADYNDKIYIC
jgi:hypothetical protein